MVQAERKLVGSPLLFLCSLPGNGRTVSVCMCDVSDIADVVTGQKGDVGQTLIPIHVTRDPLAKVAYGRAYFRRDDPFSRGTFSFVFFLVTVINMYGVEFPFPLSVPRVYPNLSF